MVLGRDVDLSCKYLLSDSSVLSELSVSIPKLPSMKRHKCNVHFHTENYLLYIITNLNPKQTTIPNYFKALTSKIQEITC